MSKKDVIDTAKNVDPTEDWTPEKAAALLSNVITSFSILEDQARNGENSKYKKLTEDWSIFSKCLHHDTCPGINGEDIKAAWAFPSVRKCFVCGEIVPESVLMIARLQEIEK